MSDECSGFSDLEFVDSISRDFYVVLCPVDEVMVQIGRCGEAAGLEVVVGASTGNGSEVLWRGRGCNRVAVDAVGHVDGHILGAHGAGDNRNIRGVARDIWRSHSVAFVIVDWFRVRRCGLSAVGVLVVDGERVAIDGIRHRHVHVIVRHVAAHRSRIRGVALDDG